MGGQAVSPLALCVKSPGLRPGPPPASSSRGPQSLVGNARRVRVGRRAPHGPCAGLIYGLTASSPAKQLLCSVNSQLLPPEWGLPWKPHCGRGHKARSVAGAGGAVLGAPRGPREGSAEGRGPLPRRHGEGWGRDQDASFHSLSCTGRMQKVESKWIQRLSTFI